ncbi:MAG: hypothetical protein ABEN55_04775, partial [Bradymonadaceae bacterium]
SVFGPPAPPPTDSAGAVEQRTPESRSFAPSRIERWSRLMERRGQYHPFRCFGFERADIDAAVDEALTYLPEHAVVRTDDGTVVPGPHGHPAAPDLVFPSLTALDIGPDNRVGIVRAPGLNGWDAEATALQIDRAADLEARAIGSQLFGRIPPGHGVRAARWFEKQCRDDRSAVVSAIAEIADDHDLDILIVPPVIGATIDRHRPIWTVIREATEAAVAEHPPATDPVFGWRLYRACRSIWEDSAVARMPAAASVELDDDRAISLTDREGDQCLCDAVVLATGRWFGGGMPGDAPMVEALTGAPIWLDGAPMTADDELFPPDYLDDLPWDDHELFRTGVQVETTGRLLDRDGDAYDNIFGAGRLLAGFNPFHDGCALGVELVTGLAAGRRAADAVSDVSIPRDEFDSLETS